MRLAVKYGGTEVDRGRMDALDLGPAIFGLGEMVGQTSRILFNDSTRVKVEVRADFPHASFGIEFLAVAAEGAGIIGALTLEQLAQIAEVLGFGLAASAGVVKGVIGLYRWQRGRRIDTAERTGDQIRLKIHDESVNVSVVEYNVFIDPTVRNGFRALVEPLKREGVDTVSIQADDGPKEVINRRERPLFAEAPLPEEELAVDRSTAVLEIVSISFREGNKWRFAQGAGTFYADILDEAFLAKVAAQREFFASGDALRVEMEIQTVRAGTELQFERKIIRVLEHLRAPRGGQLPLL
jgi:hypothetical protein